jgi:alkylated DNA repair dioxygenase AlkB
MNIVPVKELQKHIDNTRIFGDTIVSVSLGAQVVMEPRKTTRRSPAKISHHLERRSNGFMAFPPML